MARESVTIVIHCMDHRIQETVDRLLLSLGLWRGNFVRVSVAGGAGNFSQLKEHLFLAANLHAVKRIVLTTHEGCAAGATRDDLQDALLIACDFAPDVQAFFLRLNGQWEKVE